MTIVFNDGSAPGYVKAASMPFEGGFAVFYADGKFPGAYPAAPIREVR